MKTSVVHLIKIILGIILITQGEMYFMSLLSYLGIISSLSSTAEAIISVVYYLLVLILMIYLYKDDISDFRRFKRNLFPNTLMCIVFFMVLTIVVFLTDNVGNYLSETLDASYVGVKTFDIFTKTINIYYALGFLKNVLIIPTIKVLVFVLGINNLINSKKRAMIFSGLVAAWVAKSQMIGTNTYLLINIIPYFVIYFALSYIYRKNNTNICYSIMTFILFNLFGSILLTKLFGG